MTTFTDEQYQALSDEMRRSAQAGLPIVADYLAGHAGMHWQPNRIIDVGCGHGWWARECFDRWGSREVLGIDGPFGGQAIRDRDDPMCRYAEADVTRLMPPDDRRWDLAVCLEVAEHLSPQQAEPFVATLQALAPVVVFSAAIPGQGGIGHVNEQWPDYWAAMFRDSGWRTSGEIRRALWDEPGLAPYYAQNMFVAWEPGALQMVQSRPVRGVVHPKVWSHVTGRG